MRIGIDMGGTTIKFGVIDRENHIVAQSSISTNLHVSPETVIEEMVTEIRSLLEKNNWKLENCQGIGIGCAGMIDSKAGIVLYSNNYNWKDVPIVKEFKRYVSCPIAVANDADTAALGEVCAGAAMDEENAVLLTIGTGVGSGVILNRTIFQGALKGGCEFGHVVIVKDGKQCTCGRKGCLEAYASATGLIQLAKEKLEQEKNSLLYQWSDGNLETINGKMVFDAASAGDQLAKQVVEEFEDYLACGIANVINTFRPGKVIIGGGIAAQGETLTSALQKRVNDQCFGGDLGTIATIVTSSLGNSAGIIGAANLITNKRKDEER